MRRHPRGRTQPRKQTECLAFIGARRRGARGLARAGGTDLGAQLAPARRIAAGARGPPWRQKARLQAKEPHKLASGRMRRGANPDSVLHSDTRMHTHVCVHARTHTHARVCVYLHLRVYTRAHRQGHAQVQAHTQAHNIQVNALVCT